MINHDKFIDLLWSDMTLTNPETPRIGFNRFPRPCIVIRDREREEDAARRMECGICYCDCEDC